jgi:hypothetical protein
MARTALLIRCDVYEAGKIRTESRRTRQTIAGYVLHHVLQAVTLDDQIFSKPKHYRPLDRSLSARLLLTQGLRFSFDAALKKENESAKRQVVVPFPSMRLYSER